MIPNLLPQRAAFYDAKAEQSGDKFRGVVGVFSQNKGDKKNGNGAELSRFEEASTFKPAQEAVSTLGHGMVITGNIVSGGTVQIFGRVIGDIHAAQLVICDGAQVEGKVVAEEAVVHGDFKGTIHGNSVKLQGIATVEGEIFNKSLTVEPNVQFEGMSRRLEKPVESPARAEAKDEKPALVPNV